MQAQRISPADVKSYNRDGAVLIRNLFDRALIDVLRQGLDEINAVSGDMTTRNTTSAGQGRFMLDQYPSMRNARLAAFIRDAGLGEIAAALLGSGSANYILDQAFYKEPGFIQETAWHQDSPFMNVRGMDLARLWICCDPSPRELTVQVIRGSHLWNVLYRPSDPADVDIKEVESAKFSYYSDGYDDSLPKIPDFNKHLDSFDVMRWDVAPGDLLAFNSNIIHGAGGLEHHPLPRRALAVLWGGDDVRYCRRPGQGLPDRADLLKTAIPDGSPVRDHPDVFPPISGPALVTA